MFRSTSRNTDSATIKQLCEQCSECRLSGCSSKSLPEPLRVLELWIALKLSMFECRLDHWKFLARARKSTGTILFVVKMCVYVAILMRVRVMTAIPQNGPGIRFFDPVLPKLLMEVLIMWGSSTKNYGSEHQTWSDYRLWFVQQLWSPLKTIVFGACVYFGLRGRLKVDYCSSPSRKLTRAPQTWSKWWFPWKSQL